MLKEYVDALKNGNGYQFICDNGYDMTKSELCDIIKEFTYVVGGLSRENVGSIAYLEEVAESISDNYVEYDEDWEGK